MFFEKDIISFKILDVFEIKQKDVNTFNSGRNFSALSFRFRADTVLKTEKHEYRLKDGAVSYVPARLDYTRISGIDELIVVHFDTVNDREQGIEYFAPQDPEPFAELFLRVLEVWDKRESGYKYKCSAILYEILSECYAQNRKQEVQASKISRSVEYILGNYKNSEISVGEIAEKSFMSEVYFRKLFKKEYGISPKKYIMDLRIRNAASLILTGYYSLKEVAFMSGYNDYKHFSVEFKRAIGVSPSEYMYNYKE